MEGEVKNKIACRQKRLLNSVTPEFSCYLVIYFLPLIW